MSATSYRIILLGFAQYVKKRGCGLEGVRRRHIEDYLARGNVGPGTTAHRLSVIRTFFGSCVERGLLKTDPTAGIKPPRRSKPVPRNVPADTVARVLSNAEPRVRAMIILALQLGLRRGEIAALEVGDIDLVSRRVLVRSKGRKQRVLPLTDEAAEAIRGHLAERGHRAGPLFPSLRTGGHLRPNTVGQLVARASEGLEEEGLGRRVTTHQYRHTEATDVLRAGADVRQVQAMLGHESLQTTARYLAFQTEGLAAVMEGRRYRRPGAGRSDGEA